MTQYIRRTLRAGLYGWRVVDCVVTMNACDYFASDGSRVGDTTPRTTAADFRDLTPLVVMLALQEAGTVVCEPMHHFKLDIPTDTLGPILLAIGRLQGIPDTPSAPGASYALEGEIPAARVHELQQRLPALTRGEGELESTFDRYRPVRGPNPTRPRSDNNPLNRKEYLLHLRRRV
jgi:ribosomal protection tetracycline resistance protein